MKRILPMVLSAVLSLATFLSMAMAAAERWPPSEALGIPELPGLVNDETTNRRGQQPTTEVFHKAARPTLPKATEISGSAEAQLGRTCRTWTNEATRAAR